MSLLTTADVCRLTNRSTITVRNWRAGFHWREKKKHYFFEDHQGLPHMYDKEQNKLFYREEDVYYWMKRLQEKRSKNRSLTP
jgi:hypothetical protein